MPAFLWHNRAFVRLWLAQVASNVGDQFYGIALLWYLLQQTKSPSALSLVSIPDMAAGFLFYLAGGMLADRLSPRRLMIGADLARMAIVLVVGTMALLRVDQFAWFLLAQFGIGMFTTLFHPARTVALRTVLPPGSLGQANAVLDTTFRTIRIAAPMMIGVLASVLPLAVLFYANAASYLFSALCVRSIRHPLRDDSPAFAAASALTFRQYWIDVRQATTEVWHKRMLFYILLFGNMGYLVWQICWTVGFPVLADQLGKGDAGMLGTLIGFYGVGNLVGSLLMTRITCRNPLLFILAGWMCQSVGYLTLAFSGSHLPVVFASAAMAGLGGPVIGIPLVTAIQTEAETGNTGKIYGLNMLGYTWFSILSSTLGALWLGRWPIERLFAASGLFLLAMTATGYFLGRREWKTTKEDQPVSL